MAATVSRCCIVNALDKSLVDEYFFCFLTPYLRVLWHQKASIQSPLICDIEHLGRRIFATILETKLIRSRLVHKRTYRLYKKRHRKVSNFHS